MPANQQTAMSLLGQMLSGIQEPVAHGVQHPSHWAITMGKIAGEASVSAKVLMPSGDTYKVSVRVAERGFAMSAVGGGLLIP